MPTPQLRIEVTVYVGVKILKGVIRTKTRIVIQRLKLRLSIVPNLIIAMPIKKLINSKKSPYHDKFVPNRKYTTERDFPNTKVMKDTMELASCEYLPLKILSMTESSFIANIAYCSVNPKIIRKIKVYTL
jgi:hypothetical protein